MELSTQQSLNESINSVNLTEAVNAKKVAELEIKAALGQKLSTKEKSDAAAGIAKKHNSVAFVLQVVKEYQRQHANLTQDQRDEIISRGRAEYKRSLKKESINEAFVRKTAAEYEDEYQQELADTEKKFKSLSADAKKILITAYKMLAKTSRNPTQLDVFIAINKKNDPKKWSPANQKKWARAGNELKKTKLAYLLPNPSGEPYWGFTRETGNFLAPKYWK